MKVVFPTPIEPWKAKTVRSPIHSMKRRAVERISEGEEMMNSM